MREGGREGGMDGERESLRYRERDAKREGHAADTSCGCVFVRMLILNHKSLCLEEAIRHRKRKGHVNCMLTMMIIMMTMRVDDHNDDVEAIKINEIKKSRTLEKNGIKCIGD
jgi:hypothetical protein